MYSCPHVYTSTYIHDYISTWLHHLMNFFRPYFLYLSMLGFISLYTLFHDIFHKGTDSKTFFVGNGLHFVHKGF